MRARRGPGRAAAGVGRAEARRAEPRVAYAVAITGVAGPAESEDKPVGLVHFALASAAGTRHVEKRFGRLDRAMIRDLSARQALQMLLEG